MHRALALLSQALEYALTPVVSGFLASVSYFTHARSALLYGLTESKPLRGGCRINAANEQTLCVRRTAVALDDAGSVGLRATSPEIDEEGTWPTLIISGPTPGR